MRRKKCAVQNQGITLRVLKSLTRAKRIFSVSPQVSLSVFSLVPDLLFDYSRVLEYVKTRIVLQSNFAVALLLTPVFYTLY